MRATDPANHINRQHDRNAPDNRYLPETSERSGENGDVDGAAAKEYQHKSAKHFRQAAGS
jgi:hypothetical protein